jgi:serine/threonine-protein kinase
VTTTPDSPDGDDPYADAVAELLEARDAGTPLPLSIWLGRHPVLADGLRNFLDETDGVATALRSFRCDAREPDLRTSERFLGDYELIEKIGGNMGVVYRARQKSLPRDTAVKVLLRAGTHDREQFLAEARAMARLDHPHILRIYEVSRADGLPYFAMEWCPAGTLAARVAEYTAHPDKVNEVLVPVARAIHFAHRRAILHRDLKPANILFDEFGQPRVADFGLAVPLDSPGGDFAPRAGTPPYMAPEQLTGEVTVATDVYGLGAVLYELLTGRPPRTGPTVESVLEQVRTTTPPPPRTLNPRIDPDLDAICGMCLARDPANRYASAEEVAKDLCRYEQGLPTIARPLGPLGRVAHIVRHARTAAEFRSLAPGLFGMAAITIATNFGVFALLRNGGPELLVWACLFVSYLLLFGMLVRERWQRAGYHPGQSYLRSVWAGHAIATAAVFLATRFAADDWIGGIEDGYIGCAGINTLAFTVMGCLFTGRQYLLGLAWAGTTVLMGLAQLWSPVFYGVLMAACNILTGLHLRAVTPAEPERGSP